MVDTLVEMKELNEKANEAMGLKNRFLNNISHNLAAPIKGVVDADERIKSATDDSDIIACTEEIQKLCASVLGHMDDILEYVDLDLDNLVIEEKKYNVYDMMDVCIKGLEDEAQKKGIAIVRQFSSIPQFLCGDRERIAQALRKLIKNAIEYTETGTITIRLQSREINKESRYLIISVEDTGIGIPENMHKHIFEVFEKGNDTNKGMGVGLSYAKRVVELMGGHVDMYSTEGKGSLFYIEVPQKNVFESI